MSESLLLTTFWLLAQGAEPLGASTSRSIEFDWPQTAGEWTLFAALALAALFTIGIIYRDTRWVARPWTAWLTLLRLGVLAGLVVIALNPQERTQKQSYRPSQVVLLVDTSTSMRQPEIDPRLATSTRLRTRAEAIHELLAESPLIEELQKTHAVDVYTFDSDLSESRHRFPSRFTAPAMGPPTAAREGVAGTQPDWGAILEPQGLSTRLGDSLDTLLAEVKGKTLAGVVLFSDGASNVGRDGRDANERARQNSVRLFAVGIGSTEPPLNLHLARLIAPTDVQKGDAFEITALIQSQGLAGRTIEVELSQRHPDETEPVVVATQSATLLEDGTPVELAFERTPDEAAELEYSVRIRPPAGVLESRDDDNLQSKKINVFDRPMKVLVVAGGPMRDYRFARNVLHRHKSMEVDVWLQTGGVGISQDADELRFGFPVSREDLFQYDVLIAFDADWSQVTDTQQTMLEEWVSNEGGGLILVAGDVYTSQLAAADEELNTIRNLYPVLLEKEEPTLLSRDSSQRSQPWKVGLTQEGKAAAFLQLSNDPANASEVWEEFPGVYRCYPTRGVKGGTTVYAEFTDPLSRGSGGPPVLLASQRYSQGNAIYLGSPETWRLRSLNEEYYDRFWTKLVRRAAEGRTKRGLQRAMLILEGEDYDLGATVPIRARVLNAQFQPLEAASTPIEIYDPDGRPMVPPLLLQRDRNRPAEFVGDFRAAQPGVYRLELAVPDTSERVTSEIRVMLPQREVASLQQDARLLKSLVEGTGGKYLSIDQAAELPALIPNMGQEFIIDQRLRELWDRQWVLFLLVGLLAAEWLTRKLLKLA